MEHSHETPCPSDGLKPLSEWTWRLSFRSPWVWWLNRGDNRTRPAARYKGALGDRSHRTHAPMTKRARWNAFAIRDHLIRNRMEESTSHTAALRELAVLFLRLW